MTTPNNTPPTRIERRGHLMWLKLSDLKIDGEAQRDLRPSAADKLAVDFDINFGSIPVVSKRDGSYFVVDGQHRIEALRRIGHQDSELQCWVRDDLDLPDEAELFLRHNDSKAVTNYDKFRVALTAGRPVEADVQRIVMANGLRISTRGEGTVKAVTSLVKVYKLGPAVLGKTLRILRDAYGDAGLQGDLITGVGMVVNRYGATLDEADAVARLGTVRGGLGALTTKANGYKKTLGRTNTHCIAAAAVDIINAGRPRNKKLPGWWS